MVSPNLLPSSVCEENESIRRRIAAAAAVRSAEHSEPGCCGGVCAEVNLRLAHGTSAEQVRLVRDKVAELSVTPPIFQLSVPSVTEMD